MNAGQDSDGDDGGSTGFVPHSVKPRLWPGVRLHLRRGAATASGGPSAPQWVLLHPEAYSTVTGPGKEILELCDGNRTFGEILAILAARHPALGTARLEQIIWRYLCKLRESLLVDVPLHAVPLVPAATDRQAPSEPEDGNPSPVGLVAEVTFRCPLHCPYCSNPTRYPSGKSELSATEWCRVFAQAAELGVLHAMFTGGEPLARPDLESLIASAGESGLYTNLITSAVGLTAARLESLRAAGLESVQISFQSDDQPTADLIAGAKAHEHKLAAARLVVQSGLPLTVNVVLHRWNVERIDRIIALAEELGARRLELASTQFYGWAFRNRDQLLPTREQVEAARIVAARAHERLRGTAQVLYVVPDYFGTRPKACMGGWGRNYLAVNPVGDVLPCPTAYEISALRFENVRDRDLGWIWNESESFNRFRGTGWMPEPCRSCELQEVDFGGCRCQAALLTGSAENTDPACSLSPHHAGLVQLVAKGNAPPPALMQLQYRINPTTVQSSG